MKAEASPSSSPPPSPAVTTLEFLRAVHGGTDEGYIETRVLSDSDKVPTIDRGWHATSGALVDDLPRLMELAEARAAGIFFGVLRRREVGQGKNEHAMPGRAVWADLDFKDYEGGEAEARDRLEKFSIKPSIVVRSAHGLHAYWLLSETVTAALLSDLAKAVAAVLDSDSVHDAARLLRLPGTFNRKDPANPVLVEIEFFEPEGRCAVLELKAALATAKAASKSRPKPATGDPAGQAEGGNAGGMSERVLALVRNNKKVSNMFLGFGKPKAGNKGQLLDTSGSGYDYSFVVALVEEGVLDEDELAAALAGRPDGHARNKGADYIERTVKNVLDKFAPRDVDPYEELQIAGMVIFDSNPPIYQITAMERTFRMTADDLASVKKFRVQFLGATHTVPQLPGQDEWPLWVNLLLDRAERREMPPEASTEPALREAVTAAIEDMPITDAPEELAAGKAVDLGDGRKGFRENSVRKVVKEDFPTVGRQDISRVLKELGFQSGTHRVGDGVRRLWAAVTAP